METPDIDGLEILGLIGDGACGSVFLGRRAAGDFVAVRRFDPTVVNLPLIEGMFGRIKGSTYPEGMVPLSWIMTQDGDQCLEMPLLADIDPTKGFKTTPRTLEQYLNDHEEITNSDAWQLVEKIAQALANMHLHRIPHGNLKPGNIFFDDKGEILLADFAMGHMPGIDTPPITDALLYAAPEQLEQPKDYLSGKGYIWDCHAFGTIAFQLLTGKLPLCKSSHHKVTPPPHQRELSPAQADLISLSHDLEKLSLSDWIHGSSDPLELKHRKIIQRCLALDPNERYADLSEVLHAWHDIDTEAEVDEIKSELKQKTESNRLLSFGTGALAAAGIIGCLVLGYQLQQQKEKNTDHGQKITDLQTQLADQVTQEVNAQASEAKALAAQAKAETKEKKHREQLIALGVANDHLLAWMMRDNSKELPELQKSGNAREAMVIELEKFLRITEDNNQFQPVRARIMMQLAELKIHQQKPEQADQKIDAAVEAWNKAEIEEPGHAYRVARARLGCLILAMDQQKHALAQKLLPKARQAAQSNQTNDNVENQRLKAIMHVIDGRMVQVTDPTKALELFQQAIQEMQGIRRTLTENILVRSDLARYTLEAANLAESLNKIDDAQQLREEAASSLEKLLAKNPSLHVPKIQLAHIHIMAATAQIREGNDKAGTRKLDQADKLLATLPQNDFSPAGAAMQVAAAKGLRAVLLRDSGKNTAAKNKLNEAIALTEKIVAAQEKNIGGDNEPLYRLAVLHWQLAGITGDAGDRKAELKQGKKAADLMEDLLKKGAGKHDTGIRRALGYLYGDLAHTASALGNKSDAASYYNNAATIWQSLITKYGKREEYTDGLKWSQSRYKEIKP